MSCGSSWARDCSCGNTRFLWPLLQVSRWGANPSLHSDPSHYRWINPLSHSGNSGIRILIGIVLILLVAFHGNEILIILRFPIHPYEVFFHLLMSSLTSFSMFCNFHYVSLLPPWLILQFFICFGCCCKWNCSLPFLFRLFIVHPQKCSRYFWVDFVPCHFAELIC